jgi:ceramide glucosyltransferase
VALQVLLVVLAVGSLGFYAAGAWHMWRFFGRGKTVAGPRPPVSVMVPVAGFDATTRQFLEALCRQDYPDYEILIGTTDPKDPAAGPLGELAAAFPGRVRLFLGLPPRGANYKDSILSYLLEAARHEVIVFADSDLRIGERYLDKVVSPLADPAVGLVTFPYADQQPETLAQAAASLGRCIDFVPGILLARALDDGLRFALGITLATRKSTLAMAGGLHLDRIGSDYNLGKRIAATGHRVELSTEALDWATAGESPLDVFRRELRWARSIRFNRGAQYYSMVLCHGTIIGLLLVLLTGAATWAVALCVAVFGVRCLQAWICARAMRCDRLVPWLWILPLRDALSFAVWLAGSFGRQVMWRGRVLRIRGDGLISEDGLSGPISGARAWRTDGSPAHPGSTQR